MPKCDFNKVALHGCSPVNLLYIFRTSFPKNTSGGLVMVSLFYFVPMFSFILRLPRRMMQNIGKY